MRKLRNTILIALVVSILFSFGACKSNVLTEESDVTTTKAQAANLDEVVKIEVPLASIDAKYKDDLNAYAKDYGYISAVLNKRKNTVSITMKAFSHKLLLTRIGMKVIKDIYDFENDKKYPYLISVDDINKDDFTSAEITVDEIKYKKDGSILPYMISQDLLLYQMYTTTTDYGATVTVKNQKGEVIDTIYSSDKDK